MHFPTVAVLRILDQEHHQERDDSGAGVDDELPRVRVVKVWSGYYPGGNRKRRYGECPSGAGHLCDQLCIESKAFVPSMLLNRVLVGWLIHASPPEYNLP